MQKYRILVMLRILSLRKLCQILIITLVDDNKIAETEPINAKINNLILYAEKIIYVTE